MKSTTGVQPRPQDRKEKCGLTLCMAESVEVPVTENEQILFFYQR